MLKLTNINLPAAAGLSHLPEAAAEILRIPPEELLSLEPLRVSVDSRKKGNVCFVCSATVEVSGEDELLSRGLPEGVTVYSPVSYEFPFQGLQSGTRPVVVGTGPAGLFAALCLAEAGIPCTILERGKPAPERTADVERYWKTGRLDTHSNVQFGEGGAGTFSDGKLNTGISDLRTGYVIDTFVRFGAPADIRYLAKPHIGTDNLRSLVVNMRRHLISLGCDVRFENTMDGILTEHGRLTGVTVTFGGRRHTLSTDYLILAPGNSARDTFRMLDRSGVELEAKNFAVGVRIEHLQKNIDLSQYGQAATLGTLPASDYKLAVHLEDGRAAYTFCVCPGGRVIAASSEEGHVVTNGMSEHARDGKNICGGLLVGVSPSDFGGELFGGIRFQDTLERAAFRAGGGEARAPAQLVGDFLAKRASRGCASVSPTYQPGVRYCNLWNVLPDFVCSAIARALPEMDKKIRGFAAPDAVLTAVETRSSSPIRIRRDGGGCASVAGIYPCGEGAGFAGGITSAAVDGIRCAEAVCAALSEEYN